MKFNPVDDRYIYDLVSKNIKYFRLHNNSKYSSFGKMTQEQLAEKCDLSHSLISNIESTKVQQSFSIAVLYRIARVLEVDIKTLYINEVKLVEDILQNAQIDYKDLFLKYIDIQPEFFKAFVPSKYFVKQ